MTKLPFRARVEGLESREVPSGVPAAVVVQAHGLGGMVSLEPLPFGSYRTVSALSGRGPDVGRFTGLLQIDYAPDQFHINTGVAEFVDQAGDEIQGTIRGSFHVPRVGAASTTGRLYFDVVDGTGPFQGATGHAQIQVVRNLDIGTLKFKIHGVFRPA